jgi:2-keto-4-pentenoate hydratase
MEEPMMRWVMASLIILMTPLVARAGMPSKASIQAVANAWLEMRPAPDFDAAMTVTEAMVVQERFNALISRNLGAVVGYKAALTNSDVQRRFNYNKPVLGILYEKMVLPSPARVSAAFGGRPIAETDMVAVVGDSARLMKAKTQLETLAAIKEIRPFIELPDLVFDSPVRMDAMRLMAVNAAARLGVLGAPIPVPATPESVAKLADVTIQMLDGRGVVLGQGKGSALLGHPLNVVLWIVESLRAVGKSVRDGDLLSQGTLYAVVQPKPGTILTVRYLGLTPEPAEATVSFD